MANTLNIRRHIKSVRNTRQITRAMELVSATKMRRAQNQALKSRTYSLLAWNIIRHLSEGGVKREHPLHRAPNGVGLTLIVLLTSNRGLAGTFNSQVVNTALRHVRSQKKLDPQAGFEFVVVGKKGAQAVARSGEKIIADFEKIDVNVRSADVMPLARLAIDGFVSGVYDRVEICYTDFISTLVQKPRIKILLPFAPLDTAAQQAQSDDLGDVALDEPLPEAGQNFEYLFEPDSERVLGTLLPRLVEIQLYQAFVESNASEHSARMVAMKNASDAAGEIISDLTLEFNQIRQAAITREIAEISAGRLALD